VISEGPDEIDVPAGVAPPRTFWLAFVPGAAMMAFGLRGLLRTTDSSALWSALRWFVGGALAHDLIVSPVVCVVGFLAARWLPPIVRGPAQAALLACGVIGVVAYPLVRGYGVTPGEPSFLDRDYGTSVLALWGAAWSAAAVVVVWRVVRWRGH
jgi:hypothetical protein